MNFKSETKVGEAIYQWLSRTVFGCKKGAISMNTSPSVRTETEAGVRSIIFCRPDEYNTITPVLRDELAAAIDEADS